MLKKIITGTIVLLAITVRLSAEDAATGAVTGASAASAPVTGAAPASDAATAS